MRKSACKMDRDFVKAVESLMKKITCNERTWKEPPWEFHHPYGLTECGGGEPAEVVKMEDIRTELAAVESLLENAKKHAEAVVDVKGRSWFDCLEKALKTYGEDMDSDVIAGTRLPAQLLRTASPEDEIVVWTREHVYISDMHANNLFRAIETQPEFFPISARYYWKKKKKKKERLA